MGLRMRGRESAADGVMGEMRRASRTMSAITLASRATGFLRTLAQAQALGVSMVASCYSVANNLPNLLFEVAIGGVLVTAFLPTYVRARREGGRDAAAGYAASLAWLVLAAMGAVTVLSMAFASQLVWMQSFSATRAFDAGLATWLFRFFACEIALYSLSSVLSGVLNAERDYVASTAAPILNNAVVIAGFLGYSALVGRDPHAALLCIAVASPLGVLLQAAVQLPSLRRHGLSLRRRPTLREARLRETLALGLPTFVITAVTFVTTSFMQSSSLAMTPDGASVGYYARLWYTLPYSVLAVPVTTAAFTEVSDSWAAGDREGGAAIIGHSLGRQLRLMLPMAAMMLVMAPYMVGVLGFSGEALALTTQYLRGLAATLPLLAVTVMLQKAASSTGTLARFAAADVLAGVAQCVMCVLVQPTGMLWLVAASSGLFYLVLDVAAIAQMRAAGVGVPLRPVARAALKGLAVAAAAGLGCLLLRHAGEAWLGLSPGDGMVRSVAMCLVAGLPPLLATLAADARQGA